MPASAQILSLTINDALLDLDARVTSDGGRITVLKGGELAIALGASKAFDGDHAPILRAGAAIDTRRGDLTYNAGVGFHF